MVLPGQTGPYSGGFPPTLVRPDRNNFAPRVGFAWKPFSKTIVRGGYGINYNTGAYQGIAQQLAFQPPFSTTATNIQTGAEDLTLQNGFPAASTGGITNNYAVNPNYRLGYVQIRNLDIQQQIRPTLLMNIDYTGTKGTDLDILGSSQPNGNQDSDSECRRLSPTKIRWATRRRMRDRYVCGRDWQTDFRSEESIRFRSRSTTHPPSEPVPLRVQDAQVWEPGGPLPAEAVAHRAAGRRAWHKMRLDLAAERGLSSFNQTHKFTADYLLELPFGHDKRWLTGNTPLRAILGDWQWSGDWTIASGLPFTPRFLGDSAEINRGTNGTLRPDIVPGQSVSISNPSIARMVQHGSICYTADRTIRRCTPK